jgi:hypothetical protein
VHAPAVPVQTRPVLLAMADDHQQASQALSDGADLIDVTGLDAGERAAIRSACPGAHLWTGPRPGGADIVDADLLAAAVSPGAGNPPAAAVAAAAALGTWLGATLIRTRHVRAARRAIDMTLSIAGLRPPALTIRGLG